MSPGHVGRQNLGRPADLGASQQPHCLAERDALLASHALDRVEPFERRLEPLVVDLDPFAPQHREPVGRGDEALDFLSCQSLAVEADFDPEVEKRLGAGK